MKIGVLSDTHIPDRAKSIPQEILDAFKNVDMIIHAGDFADLNILEKLKSTCSNVKAVAGNMDPAEIKEKLPEKEIFKIGKFKIAVAHGWGQPDKLPALLAEKFKDDDVDVIVFGHSHKAFNEKIGKILFFNPGSPTDNIFAPYKSYGIIEINDKITAKIIKL
ncbi:MAG: metallophosphoesterase family protein [Candidatus Omnitrophica bacterium]|nr:metallophosphoesterase family protein [Candidatus Omnitrophota bacterium]